MKAPVITFYSYKGGVGRTFALANVAALMAKWGHRVLCVDWDLEAPGLHHYFDAWRDPAPRDGLLEWVLAREAGETPDWRAHVMSLDFGRTDVRGKVDLMLAGRFDDTYVRRVQRLDWRQLYKQHDLGRAIEEMRAEWVDAYDYVLVDSRTGITDIGGICAAQLPDILVFLVTASRQSLDGSIDAVQRARAQRRTLPVPRGGFLTLPLPARFDAREEYEAGQRWLGIFAEELAPFYRPWLPEGVTPRDALDVLRLPYLSYWSFDERIATLDERLEDPENISHPLAMVAALLVRRLQDSAQLLSERGGFGELGSVVVDRGVDFFLVYAEADSARAAEMADALRRRGTSVFFDRTDLVPGDRWDEVLDRAMSSARNLLVLWSRTFGFQWNAHYYLGRALSEASRRGLRIVPVFLDPDVEPHDMPYGLARLAGMDLSQKPWDAQLEKLVSLVQPRGLELA